MQVDQALTALTAVEEKMAGFYHWLAQCFAHDDEARHCFEQLCEQEQGHAEQLRFQQRVVRSSKTRGDVPLDEQSCESLQRKVDDFRRRNRKPLLPLAILFALKLESLDIEKFYAKLLADSIPELADLARGLSSADMAHVKLLKELLAKKKAATAARR